MTDRFSLADTPFDIAPLRARLLRAEAGAYASFEGWVRNHNDGRAALGLRYEAYVALAEAEGTKIVEEALSKFASATSPSATSQCGSVSAPRIATPRLPPAAGSSTK
jgi:molybdopterin synthase catalytic subunit